MRKYGTHPRWYWLLAIAAILFAPALFAADTSILYARPLHQEKAVTADFDGDQRPDTAQSRSWQNHSLVEIDFGSGLHLSFQSSTIGETKLVAMDVDRDNDTDLILIATESEIPAEVWLNDGRGSFSTPELWRIDASFPIPTPANQPENNERSSLANAIGTAEILHTPEAKLAETNLAKPQQDQTFHAFVEKGYSRVLLASSRRTRSPPLTNFF
jgi:hypothetical protein